MAAREPGNTSSARIVAAVVVVAVSAVVLAIDAAPAAACSCAGTVQPAHMTGEDDAAFVGRVRDRPDSSYFSGSNEPVTWTFDVDEIYVGELGPTVNVVTPAAGPSCGLSDELAVGDEVAMAVRWTAERVGFDLGEPHWTSDLCSVALDPSAFEGAVEPHPPDQAIGPGPSHTDESTQLLRYALVAAAVGALVVFGLVLVRRRRG